MTFERWLQSRLTAHGYPVGLIDGVIGPVTSAALKAFEKASGLTMDGLADPKVVQALRASAGAVPPAVMVEIPNRDLTPPAQPSPAQWPRQAGCMEFYGPVGASQVQVEIPFDMVLSWNKMVRFRKMTLHSKVAASAQRVFNCIAETYSAPERKALGIDLFGGSLNARRMRGGNSYSMYSWGIAIDFDPERNSLGTHAPDASLSHPDADEFWRTWESEGWLSLGRARDFDWMHVQAARF